MRTSLKAAVLWALLFTSPQRLLWLTLNVWNSSVLSEDTGCLFSGTSIHFILWLNQLCLSSVADGRVSCSLFFWPSQTALLRHFCACLWATKETHSHQEHTSAWNPLSVCVSSFYKLSGSWWVFCLCFCLNHSNRQVTTAIPSWSLSGILSQLWEKWLVQKTSA